MRGSTSRPCCLLPPQAVRLLTLLTLLLADASVASTLACTIHLLGLSGMLPLALIIFTGIGIIVYSIAAASSARSARRGAAVVLHHAKKGRLPKLTHAECVAFLMGDTVRGIRIPEQRRVPAHRTQGVDACVALDPERSLFDLCARTGRSSRRAFHDIIRSHALRTCRTVHSVPFYRLARFGWQPSIGPWDFAGVQRASLLWSAFVGWPSSTLNGYYAVAVAPAPDLILLAACGINLISCALVVLQLCAEFARQLLELTQAEQAALEAALRAENAAVAMEEQIARELERNVDAALDKADGDARRALPKIKRLEKRALDDRMDYLTALADNPDLAA